MLRPSPRLLSRRAIKIQAQTPGRLAERYTGEIFPHDLQATIDSHRANNRASLIRRVRPGAHQQNASKAAAKNQSGSSTTNRVRARFRLTERAEERRVQQLEDAHSDRIKNRQGHIGVYVPTFPYDSLEPLMPGDVLPSDRNAPTQPAEKLQRSLKAASEWLELSPVERAVRNGIIAQLESMLSRNLKKATIRPYGTHATGLASPLSNIDVVVEVPLTETLDHDGIRTREYRWKCMKALNQVRAILNSSASFGNVHHLQREMPLICATHLKSEINLRISVVPQGLTSAEIVNGYLLEIPNLRSVFMICRMVLRARELRPFNGGMNSYTLLMLLVAFFKLTPGTGDRDLGLDLRDFFEFVAEFNTSLNCIAADPVQIFRKRRSAILASNEMKSRMTENPDLRNKWKLSAIDERHPYLLVLQDPARPSYDLAKSCTRIMDIRQTFRKLSKMLQKVRSGQVSREPLVELFGDSFGEVRDARYLVKSWAMSAIRREHARETFARKNQTGDISSGRQQRSSEFAFDAVDRGIIDDIRTR